MVKRPHIVVSAAIMLVAGTAAVQAGPCTAQIAQLQQQVARLQANPAPGGAGEATAPQSLGAQLHHQPTPGSVQSAQHTANTDADAALGRARKADDAGDAAGCSAALDEAKRLYGL
jgi:hypothetical protein